MLLALSLACTPQDKPLEHADSTQADEESQDTGEQEDPDCSSGFDNGPIGGELRTPEGAVVAYVYTLDEAGQSQMAPDQPGPPLVSKGQSLVSPTASPAEHSQDCVQGQGIHRLAEIQLDAAQVDHGDGFSDGILEGLGHRDGLLNDRLLGRHPISGVGGAGCSGSATPAARSSGLHRRACSPRSGHSELGGVPEQGELGRGQLDLGVTRMCDPASEQVDASGAQDQVLAVSTFPPSSSA